VKSRYLSKAPLFGELSEEQLAQITEKMRLERYGKGETIFSCGEPSHTFYLVKSGWVQLVADGKVSLATIGTGSLIGDSDLLLGQAHTFGAIAAADVELWAISQEEITELVMADPNMGVRLSRALGKRISLLDHYLVHTRLRAMPALSTLSDEELLALAQGAELVTFAAQSPIFREGDCAAGLFILEDGSVQVFSSCGVDDEYVELQAGDALGEMSVLTGKTANASAHALVDTTLWTVSPESFAAIAKNHPAIRMALSAALRERLSADDQAVATRKLRDLSLFAGLPDTALADVASKLLLRHVPAGEPVYTRGDVGDALYLIESGSVSILSNRMGRDTLSQQLAQGEFFGETALLTGKTRSVTVKADVDTNLWVLYRSDFEQLVTQYPAISLTMSRLLSERLAAADRTFVARHLQSLSLLSGLTNNQLEDVNERLRPVKFRAGEPIIQEGQSGDTMYLIESGQVEIVSGLTQPVILDTLTDGEFFGEMALLTGRPRVASARAISDLDAWELKKADFDTLLLKYPQLTISLSKVLGQRLASANSRLTPERVAQPAPEMAARPARTPVTAPIRREAPPVAQRQPAMSRAERPTPAFGLQKSVVGAMGGFRRTLDNTVAWFDSCSGAAKTRLVAVTLLVAWLAGVAAPATLISSLAVYNDANVALGNAASMAVLDTAPVLEEELIAEAPQELQLAAVVLPTDTATPVPPTPTDTPVPPTETPVPPTETPVPPTATSTPEPPTPTETPVPPTPTQTYTPLPPIEAPAPAARIAAASNEQPAAVEKAAPALPGISWDGRLDGMGVHIAGVDVPAGQPYWRIVDVKWGNEEESQGKHHIYAEVLDENGGRLVGQPVVIFWHEGQEVVMTEDKPMPEYACNFPMYKTLGSYNLRVDGLPSESLIGLGLGTAELPAWTIHTTFQVKFQRTIK
jgi:CRP-like cAMP-binding protein